MKIIAILKFAVGIAECVRHSINWRRWVVILVGLDEIVIARFPRVIAGN